MGLWLSRSEYDIEEMLTAEN